MPPSLALQGICSLLVFLWGTFCGCHRIHPGAPSAVSPQPGPSGLGLSQGGSSHWSFSNQPPKKPQWCPFSQPKAFETPNHELCHLPPQIHPAPPLPAPRFINTPKNHFNPHFSQIGFHPLPFLFFSPLWWISLQ